MAFFPRHTPAFGADFAPLFRLLDEGLDLSRNTAGGRHSSVRAWSPRFDVKEHKDNYLLEGELPGIEQKNVEIEFTDPHTLVIKGRTEHEYTSTTPAAVEDTQVSGAIEEGASTPKSTESHHATVEDEDEPSTSTEVTAPKKQQQQEVTKPAQPQFKSWISERSVGEFHRSFSFPTRVDQDAVKASLKNGILSIVVPKASAEKMRKISIE